LHGISIVSQIINPCAESSTPRDAVNILIIGCGAIGATLARAAQDMDAVERMLILDVDSAKAESLAAELPKAEVCGDFDACLDGVDLVVEAAGPKAAKLYGPKALEKGKRLMLLSIGALADREFKQRLEHLAHANDCRVYFPSGAMAGIDALKAAKEAGIHEVTLVSTKPAKALMDNDYTKAHGIDLESITEPTVIFEGKAREAAIAFPKNVNVSATLSIAGIGLDETKVKVVADPGATVNVHHLIVKGDFGELDIEVRNLPSPGNLATSRLAALSAVACLRQIFEPLHVGV